MHRAFRVMVVSLVVFATHTAIAQAQPKFTFKMKPGMKFLYDFSHKIDVEAEDGDDKMTTTTVVRQLRQWEVIGVDSLGVATLEMSMPELSIQVIEGAQLIAKFDSKDLNSSNPELVKNYKTQIGKPIRRVEVAPNGVLKSSKNLTELPSHVDELPFLVSVPDDLPRPGMTWQRDYAVVLQRPGGGGNGYKAQQNCKIERIEGNNLILSSSVEIDEEAKNPEDKLYLLQFKPEGMVVLDFVRGVMVETQLKCDERIDDAVGPGSYYHFRSELVMKLIDPVAQQAQRQ